MSLYDKQALLSLAVAQGAMRTARQFNIGPRFDSLIQAAEQPLDEAISRWPAKSNNNVLPWFQQKLQRWLKHKPEIDDLSIAELTALAMTIVTDLDERTAEKHRKTKQERYSLQLSLMLPIFDALQTVLDEVDPSGNRFDTYEKVDNLVDKFYDLVEI